MVADRCSLLDPVAYLSDPPSVRLFRHLKNLSSLKCYERYSYYEEDNICIIGLGSKCPSFLK